MVSTLEDNCVAVKIEGSVEQTDRRQWGTSTVAGVEFRNLYLAGETIVDLATAVHVDLIIAERAIPAT